MARKRQELRVEMVRAGVAAHRPRSDDWRPGPVARRAEVLSAALARALGTTRRGAEVTLWGPLNLARRCARVITALKAAGADEELVRFIQPIDLAIGSAKPAELQDDGRRAAQVSS